MEIPDEANIRDYYDLRQQLENYTKDMREVITHPNYCLRFMQSGRLVKVREGEHDFGWGAVVSHSIRASPTNGEDWSPHQKHILDVLLPVASDTYLGPPKGKDFPEGIRPPGPGEKGRMEVVPVVLSCIESIGHVRIFMPGELKTPEQRNSVRKSLEEVKKRFPDGIAVLDPVENMRIDDDSFKKLLRVSVFHTADDFANQLSISRKSKYLNRGYSRTPCIILRDFQISTINTLPK
jgi:ATP-dependent RNA helicase DOB1